MGVVFMKKNLMTMIILAMGILNILLTSVIVFTMVPNTIKTNKLIDKVAASIDLEIEPLKESSENNSVKIEDIEVYPITEDITINLKDIVGSKSNYALVSASLSINTKSKDYKTLSSKIVANESSITEIIRDEFSKYNRNTVIANKDIIKEDITLRIQEYFGSDFIVGISLGKFIVE
jgi:hypothetical protein